MDDITLQDLSLSPAPALLNRNMKKEPKNFNEVRYSFVNNKFYAKCVKYAYTYLICQMMKMQSLKPSKQKMYKKLLAKEKSKLKKEHYKKKQQQKKKQVP